MNEKSEDCYETGCIVGYRCNWTECEFITAKRDHVYSHIKYKHTNERPFSCNKCEKKFAVKRYLDKHKTYIHGDGLSHKLKCDWSQCHYETYLSNNLNTHYLRHKKIKQFKCDQNGCDASFTTIGDLNCHKKTVHEELRLFLCEWPGCDTAFKRKYLLDNHRTTHTGEKPFECDFPNCEVKCRLKTDLIGHKKTHNLVKKHVCSWPQCDKSFTKRDQLVGHINRHRGQRPFKCHISGCLKSYAHKKHLAQHLKTHERNTYKL